MKKLIFTSLIIIGLMGDYAMAQIDVTTHPDLFQRQREEEMMRQQRQILSSQQELIDQQRAAEARRAAMEAAQLEEAQREHARQAALDREKELDALVAEQAKKEADARQKTP